MNHRVELVAEARFEVMTLPLGLGTEDDADRPLEAGCLQHAASRGLGGGEPEVLCRYFVQQRLVASWQCRANVFAFRRIAPVRGGGHAPRVGGEPDEQAFVPVALTRE